ncbi:RAC family serine/threonine-protein kinase like protein [Tritrichomonas foetus]|uniref:non-specific serine/threonine protein kinase n=1 Tax=Tritrichomonas foetus TaxID=1144522 RepID=A0A1J4JCR5_9EUKA|nr:RAC family serine/threonine-protein kinase like protein [Tritrichomonas foetus]|eukprot:OHS95205.1 RAC family serine/threonine-protein kinase like protein [Tritrichomonas foetus]
MSFENEADMIVKVGWCTKLGAVFKTWRRRWFVLTQNGLAYYKSPGKKLQGTISLENADVAKDPSAKKQPAFSITTPTRVYRIVGEDLEETESWIDSIKQVQEEKNRPIPASLNDFTILKVLGRGSYGKVQLVRHKKTKNLYAMKSLSKRKLAQFDLIGRSITERNVLFQANHPFIVSARYSFQTDTKIFICLDYVQGGELFSRLAEEGSFSEARVKIYAAEIVLAISYLHSIEIIHRDLKPENILVNMKGNLKLTDFGLVKEKMGADSTTRTFCGTPEYIAPEMIQGRAYNKMVDWWSVGVLIYQMLFGRQPFYNHNTNELYKMIIMEEPLFPRNEASSLAVDFVGQLLKKNPSMRLGHESEDEIFNHPWFNGIPWQQILEEQYPMEWKPTIKDTTDTSQFAPEFTNEEAAVSYEDPALVSPMTNEELRGFTYVNELLI